MFAWLYTYNEVCRSRDNWQSIATSNLQTIEKLKAELQKTKDLAKSSHASAIQFQERYDKSREEVAALNMQITDLHTQIALLHDERTKILEILAP